MNFWRAVAMGVCANPWKLSIMPASGALTLADIKAKIEYRGVFKRYGSTKSYLSFL